MVSAIIEEDRRQNTNTDQNGLIRPVHRGPTANDIFPKVVSIRYHTLLNDSPGYHNQN